jgi:hypothetical protein
MILQTEALPASTRTLNPATAANAPEVVYKLDACGNLD